MKLPGNEQEKLYGRSFFLLFAALLCYMSAYTLMVHLAKYVTYLGGNVSTVGSIFGVGMLGALATRPFVGNWIDRVGCKPILISAAFAAAVTIFILQWVRSVPSILVLRITLQLTQAAFLATIAVFAARIAPKNRSAESLAMIGVGGLAGMIVGPAIGDVVFTNQIEASSFHRFFSVGSLIMLASTILILATPSKASQPIPHAPVSYWRLVIKHWPGPIVAMGLALALVQTVPVMLIERYVAYRGIDGVTYFFLTYGLTAIVLRLALRKLPQRIGRERTLIMGITSSAIGILLLLPAANQLWLIIPASVMGLGHCFSYPFLVDLAAEAMPRQHRGTGTVLILAMVDIGFLVSFPIAGRCIASQQLGFETTLAGIAIAAMLCTAYFTVATGRNNRRSFGAPAP